jgi:hypothetical protein
MQRPLGLVDEDGARGVQRPTDEASLIAWRRTIILDLFGLVDELDSIVGGNLSVSP